MTSYCLSTIYDTFRRLLGRTFLCYIYWVMWGSSPFYIFYLYYLLWTQKKTLDRQIAKVFLRIRWDPRRAEVCREPITSGRPMALRNPRRRDRMVPKAHTIIGIDSVMVTFLDLSFQRGVLCDLIILFRLYIFKVPRNQ